MTSQKRFRHQENSNTGGRTRDLPPRFKRQKSSSGQPPLDSRSASPPSSQFDKINHSNNMTKRSQIPTPNGTTVNKGSPSQTASSGDVRYSVLRPVNYVYSDIPSTQTVPPQVYPVVPSPQMWTSSGYTGFQPVMVSPNSIMLPQTVSQVRCDSTPYINENCAPSPSIYMAQCSPMSPWNTSGYGSPYQSSCSSPAPTIPSPSPSVIEPGREKSPKLTPDRMACAKSPGAQYADPDLRTIEMLRELERVADKESQEADEGGSDRKTLVSHHLRMLMCAMDRYTENIDNEMDGSSRNDDRISPTSSNTSSPSPSPVLVARKPHENHFKGKVEEVQNHFWNRNKVVEPQLPRSRPVLGISSAPPPVQHRTQPISFNSSFSGRPSQVPHMPWIQDTQPNHQSEWNLWSSPSFNLGGVLGHPSYLGGPNEHFETFQDTCFPANKERKPLYKR